MPGPLQQGAGPGRPSAKVCQRLRIDSVAWNSPDPGENQGKKSRGSVPRRLLPTPMPEDPGLGVRGKAGSGTAPLFIRSDFGVCSKTDYRINTCALRTGSPRFIQSAHYRKLLCQNPGKDPTQGNPSSPADLNKGCAMVFYFIISFISLYYYYYYLLFLWSLSLAKFFFPFPGPGVPVCNIPF